MRLTGISFLVLGFLYYRLLAYLSKAGYNNFVQGGIIIHALILTVLGSIGFMYLFGSKDEDTKK